MHVIHNIYRTFQGLQYYIGRHSLEVLSSQFIMIISIYRHLHIDKIISGNSLDTLQQNIVVKTKGEVKT
jgi:hypothetical protein